MSTVLHYSYILDAVPALDGCTESIDSEGLDALKAFDMPIKRVAKDLITAIVD